MMESLISLVCLYLYGTVIVVGLGIAIQLIRNNRSKKQKEEPVPGSTDNSPREE